MTHGGAAMTRTFVKTLHRIILILCFFTIQQYTVADEKDDKKSSGPESQLRIDVPVKLERADVVFNMNHLVLRGDMPVGMRYMNQMATALKEAGTKTRIIGVFYNEAGHLTLNDKPYNAYRGVTTGNPYKALIAELMEQGVQIEECAETMRNHHWSNDDLLPGVKVNTGAVGRLVQLTQEGFVQIQP
jgi:intracellular sulfur oxidation DsrE/DsrF family protein